MNDYISKEDVLDNSNIITVHTKEYGSIEVIPVDTIADIELADVQDVKHGRWIDIYEWAKMHDSTPSGMCLYYWCSECRKEQEKKSNFCPNCGAKMIEGVTRMTRLVKE